MRNRMLTVLMAAMIVVAGASSLLAEKAKEKVKVTFPEKPGDREFIAETAGLIKAEDAEKIKEICDTLLTEKKVPIIVVTIESLATFGARDIELYATGLFNKWEIGFKDWNNGILLLVSKGDKKVRIELGAHWGRAKDEHCSKITKDLILSEFKRGNFSDGILGGVTGLAAMARELEIPTRPRPVWHYFLIAGVIGAAIFTIVSLIRRGASGWAWLLWAAIFAIIGTLLYQMMRSGSSGGMGYGGGSFGGGFSGGGGATGSW